MKEKIIIATIKSWNIANALKLRDDYSDEYKILLIYYSHIGHGLFQKKFIIITNVLFFILRTCHMEEGGVLSKI